MPLHVNMHAIQNIIKKQIQTYKNADTRSSNLINRADGGDNGRVPLAGLIRLILLIRAMERDVPADRIGSSGTSQNGDPNRSNMADALATY